MNTHTTACAALLAILIAACSLAADTNTPPATNSGTTNLTPALNSQTQTPDVDGPQRPSALGNGALRKISRPDNPRTYPTPYGSKTVLRDTHGERLGTATTVPVAAGVKTTTIRDTDGDKVGKATTRQTPIGVKTTLYDENGDKIGSVHRVGDNTVYRDENGHRLTRQEATAQGLR